MGLTLCGTVAVFAAQHFMLANMLVGMRARLSMVAAIYEKTTRLAVGSTTSAGQVSQIPIPTCVRVSERKGGGGMRALLSMVAATNRRN
jgi:hypothetical protein